jgi:hypothetical protein
MRMSAGGFGIVGGVPGACGVVVGSVPERGASGLHVQEVGFFSGGANGGLFVGGAAIGP